MDFTPPPLVSVSDVTNFSDRAKANLSCRQGRVSKKVLENRNLTPHINNDPVGSADTKPC